MEFNVVCTLHRHPPLKGGVASLAYDPAIQLLRKRWITGSRAFGAAR
jgi:hypothetical protein